MRFWPFNTAGASAPPESATDLATARLIDQARLPAPADPAALAVIEAAVGLVARSLAAGEVTGAGARLLPPALLAIVARRCMMRGEAVLALEGTALVPASEWSVTGGADPASWTYKLDLPAPDAVRTRTASAGDVVHIRWTPDATEPWRGRGPVERAGQSAELATATERNATREAALVTRWMLSLRERLTPDQHKQLSGLLETLAGARNPYVPMAGTHSGTAWTRIGQAPTDPAIRLRRDALAELAGALGVPFQLLAGEGEGASQREAYRRFLHTVVEPMGAAIAGEVSAKGALVELSFRALRADDLQGRSRALANLVKAGVPMDRALEIAGL